MSFIIRKMAIYICLSQFYFQRIHKNGRNNSVLYDKKKIQTISHCNIFCLFKENIRKYIKMIKVVLSGGIIYDGWFEYFSL